jgi:hypothetical protein
MQQTRAGPSATLDVGISSRRQLHAAVLNRTGTPV